MAARSIASSSGRVIHSDGDDRTVVRLRANVPLRVEDGAVVAEFTLRAGESASFIIEDANEWPDTGPIPSGYVADLFKETMNFWRGWVR